MNRGVVLVGLCCATLLVPAPPARAETADLELRTLPDSPDYGTKHYYLGMTSSQSFWMQPDMPDQEPEPRFDSVVKKEPKYQCKYPLKRVAKLGSYQYAFALDSTNLTSKGYDRLYLDRNRNGDLTDEEPIKAKRSDTIFGGNYRQREFPSQKLEVQADGKTFTAPCGFSASSSTDERGKLDHASARLQNAAYREGKITVDGRPRHIFLLDYNNNGRFDDLFAMDENIRMNDGRLYAQTGDMILIDPQFKKDMYSGYSPIDSGDRQYLSKLVNVDGRYYKITTTTAGDRITLEPANLPTGAIANDSGPFRAVVFGDQGLVKITGDKGKPAAVPAGKWKLLEYQIDLTGVPTSKPATRPEIASVKPAGEKSEPAAEKSETDKAASPKKKSLGERLADLFGADSSSPPMAVNFVGPRYTLVRARATDKMKAVKVAEGKTETLAFGPPYKPVVSVSYVDPKAKEARLEMKLVGLAGEVCEAMTVKGNQPGTPAFQILKTNGELVKKGQFEYG